MYRRSRFVPSAGGDVQGRQRRGAAPPRAVTGTVTAVASQGEPGPRRVRRGPGGALVRGPRLRGAGPQLALPRRRARPRGLARAGLVVFCEVKARAHDRVRLAVRGGHRGQAGALARGLAGWRLAMARDRPTPRRPARSRFDVAGRRVARRRAGASMRSAPFWSWRRTARRGSSRLRVRSAPPGDYARGSAACRLRGRRPDGARCGAQQRVVPVAAEVGRGEGHDHEVAGAGLDVAVAARAPVALGGLVGLDAAQLDGRARRVPARPDRGSAAGHPSRAQQHPATSRHQHRARPRARSRRPRPGTGGTG